MAERGYRETVARGSGRVESAANEMRPAALAYEDTFAAVAAKSQPSDRTWSFFSQSDARPTSRVSKCHLKRKIITFLLLRSRYDAIPIG